MTTEVGRAKFVLETEKGQFSAGLQAARGEAQSATAGISRSFASVGSQMRNVGWSMTKYVTAPIIAGLGGSAAAAIKWESQWISVTKTVDGTAEEMRSLEADLRQLARTTTGTHKEIAQFAMLAGQMGVQVGAIKEFTRTMVQLQETTNIVGEEGVLAIARFMKVMGTTQDRVGDVGNVLVALGNNFEASEAEILEFASTLQSMSRVVGLTEPQVLALSASLASAGLEAAASGSSMQRTMVAIEKAVLDGGETLEMFAQVAGQASDEFAESWRENSGQALMAFLGGLGRVQKAGLPTIKVLEALDMENIRMTRTLLGLTVTIDSAGEAQELANEEFTDGAALTDEYAKKLDTTAVQLGLLRDRVYDASITIGKSLGPTVKVAVRGLGFLIKGLEIAASFFAELPLPVRLVVVGLLLLVAAIGPLLMVFGMLAIAVGGMIALLPHLAAGFAVLTTSILPVVASILAAIAVLLVVAVVVAAVTFGLIKLIDNWESVQETLVGFARSVPRALDAAMSAIFDFVQKVGRAGLAAMIAFGKGLKKGAQAVLDMMRDFIRALAGFFNPFKGFSLSLYDAADRAGRVSGRAFTQRLREETRGIGHQVAVDAAPDRDALEDEFGETGEAAGEALADGIARGLRGVRDQITSLHDEIQRLTGLDTVESVAEDLKRAQLELESIDLEKAVDEQEEARKRQIDSIEGQIEALEDERGRLADQYGNFAFLFTDSVDGEISALQRRKKELEEQESPEQRHLEQVEKEIDVLDRLARTRDLEREILELRGLQADQTLATDREVMVAMEQMIGTVRDVTAEIAVQTDHLWTQWVPALKAGSEAGEGAADDLEGLGDMLEGLGDVEFEVPDLTVGLTEAFDEAKAKIGAWFGQNKFAVIGAGVGAIIGGVIGGILGGPVGIGVGAMIGAGLGIVVGHMIDKWGGEAWGKVKDFFAEFIPTSTANLIATIAGGVIGGLILGPMGIPVGAYLGSRFGEEAAGKALGWFGGVWDTVTGFLASFIPSSTAGTLAAIAGGILGGLILGPIGIPVGAALGSRFGGDVAGKVTAWVGKAWDALKNAVSLSGDFLGTLRDIGEEIGKAIWNGIKSGLGNLGQWIIDKIADMIPGAPALVGGFEKAWGATGGRLFGRQTGDLKVGATGPYLLHRGEMVVPAGLAEALRRGDRSLTPVPLDDSLLQTGAGGGLPVTINVESHVETGVQDWESLRAEVMRIVEERLDEAAAMAGMIRPRFSTLGVGMRRT